MRISEKKIDKLYIFAILVLFAGIFFSYILISISQFILVGIWILEGQYKDRLKKLWQDIPALIFLSLFVTFIIGGIWTKDFNTYLNELKIKLPLFAIPFLLITKKNTFSQKQIKFLLISFIVFSFSKSVESWFVYFDNNGDIELNMFCAGLSHIRYAIYTVFSIFIIYNYSIKMKSKIVKIVSIPLIIYFLALLVILQSLTAIIIIFILTGGLTLYYLLNSKNIYTKISVIIGSLAIVLLVSLYLYNQISGFYNIKDPEYENLPVNTINNNKYFHNINNKVIENGYHVGYYICEKELQKEWNIRSEIKYKGFDKKNQKIKYTLLRYMTSKGLTKDSVGIWALTENDIANIGKGYTNYRFTNNFDFNERVYKVFWQLHVYSQTGNSNSQSISQRIEFFKTSLSLLKKHPLFGVGTGDYKKELIRHYESIESKVKPEQRNLSHNQYLSTLLALGFIFGGWVIISFFIPYFKNKKFKKFLPTVFFIIIITSMLSDDTLIRASSVNFTAIFYTLLILQKNKTNDY